MKVKIIGGRVGMLPNGIPWSQSPGDVIEVPYHEAVRLIEAMQAEAVEPQQQQKPQQPKR